MSAEPAPASTASGDDPVYQRLRIPIRPHVDAELFVPFPMTETDWRQFQAVLAAMKPGLVAEPDVARAMLAEDEA